MEDDGAADGMATEAADGETERLLTLGWLGDFGSEINMAILSCGWTDGLLNWLSGRFGPSLIIIMIIIIKSITIIIINNNSNNNKKKNNNDTNNNNNNSNNNKK